jgi:peptidoglycan/LPS O-acetylase OafA/YrhL
MQRLHFIDGLRGIASLLIVFHHSVTSAMVKLIDSAGLNYIGIQLSNFTQSGVELFFVLSGVLLLAPYLQGSRKMDVKKYYVRRFSRIYPTYAVAVIFASGVIFINYFFPTWYSQILIKPTTFNFIKQFFIFNQNWDYYNLAWWSLQIEILFYILCPLIVVFLVKFRKSSFSIHFCLEFLIVLTISIIFQYLFLNLFSNNYGVVKIHSNLFRIVDYIPAFYLGVSLALGKWSLRKTYFGFSLGLILILIGNYYHPFFNMGYAFFYASLMNFLFIRPNYQKLISSYIFIWLGERSYSLFLVHFSVFYLVNWGISWFVLDRSLLYGALSRGIGLFLSLFVAMLLFWFIERKSAKGLVTQNDFFPKLKF